MAQRISIVIPVYNEAENIARLLTQLTSVLNRLPKIQAEIIFVDDGSTDQTEAVIAMAAHKDRRIRYVGFSRNFGKEVATTAGLKRATGNAAVIMDADLQHPPQLLPQFLAAWQNGAVIVIGVRATAHASFFKSLGANTFYKLLNTIADVPVTPNATDYRLLDRVAINQFLQFTEHNRITRGLIDWLGLPMTFLPFAPPKRYKGRPGYTYLKLFRLAVTSFISLSRLPLKVAAYLGGAITLFSGTLGLFIFIEKYILNDPWHLAFSGPAILAVINLFLIGIVLMCMGIIAFYIADVHTEVMNRPMYIVKREFGFPNQRKRVRQPKGKTQ